MKEVVGLLLLILLAAWLYRHSDPGQPAGKPGDQAQVPVVVAPVSTPEQSQSPTMTDTPHSTLAQDDAAMARERLRRWQEQTTVPRRSPNGN